MVIASKNLLKEVRKLSIENELFTMRPRGVLEVAPVVVKLAKKSDGKG